ncbi:nuclease [Patescibacteria group bacterium]|nr:MAG: nuclease [Patescibacteria group bacterium]
MAKPWYARKRFQKKLISLLIGLIIVAAGYYSESRSASNTTAAPAPAGMYHIVRFDDGDTIVVDMNGVEEKIRFIGVDTPETQDPRKAVQCFGKAASNYTQGRIGDQPIRLETDPLSTNRDRYNRLLRYVYLPDGTLMNLDIIQQGYGFAYLSFPFTKSDEFRAAQTTAREQTKGLWSSCKPTPNQYGGYTSNDE